MLSDLDINDKDHPRNIRLHIMDERPTVRTTAQRDRDRILYSWAFRRLGGVTQVVDPSEGYIFHNRLTHSLKVAQIARRLAEKLSKEQPDTALALGGLDADVVEAAALAHDIGHPPFGHVAERELNSLVCEQKLYDGYEGNAQTFRILVSLEPRSIDGHDRHLGLNLTRATLNAVMKYPWIRGKKGGKRQKWSVYSTEKKVFDWAQEPLMERGRRTLEAEIMDWADDIAFSVHDMEDFYQAGLIPPGSLSMFELTNKLKRKVIERWRSESLSPDSLQIPEEEKLDEILAEFSLLLPFSRPFENTSSRRAQEVERASTLIDRYISGIKLNTAASLSRQSRKRKVVIDNLHRAEIRILKELTWLYVINNPSLATQQYGKKQIIHRLFSEFLLATESKHDKAILPSDYEEKLELIRVALTTKDKVLREKQAKARLVADIISNMTDAEAIATYQRLTGISTGSVSDKSYYW